MDDLVVTDFCEAGGVERASLASSSIEDDTHHTHLHFSLRLGGARRLDGEGSDYKYKNKIWYSQHSQHLSAQPGLGNIRRRGTAYRNEIKKSCHDGLYDSGTNTDSCGRLGLIGHPPTFRQTIPFSSDTLEVLLVRLVRLVLLLTRAFGASIPHKPILDAAGFWKGDRANDHRDTES